MTLESAGLVFACSWWRPKEPTWSYTPASLRQGLLETGVKLVDIEVQPSLPVQALMAGSLTALGRRPWKYTDTYRALEAIRLRRAVTKHRPRAVIQMADLTYVSSAPSYVYQDMNFSVAVEHYAQLGSALVSTIPAKLSTLQRLADRQLEDSQKLDGVLAMGAWYRDFLIRQRCLPAQQIHVVGGGISAAYLNLPPRNVRPRGQRDRVLFIGGDFMRKGGDWVVEAIRRVNQQGGRRLRLTVAGPPSWPMPEPCPDWVNYEGAVSRARAKELFASHDIFVMPSRFEAYGVVFLEARAMGLPCVGRDAFAMPELIEPGIGGAVWQSEHVVDLAELIVRTLDNDELHARCARDAAGFAEAHSWLSVARRILDVMNIHPHG